MALFRELATIATDGGFQSRVQYAMSVAALAVYNEAPSTEGHQQRAQFAIKVLNGQFNLVEAAWATVTNSTIAAEAQVATTPDFNIADADIQFQVNAIWNALSGA